MARAYPPTARQLDLLRYIAGYQCAHEGRSPSLHDCMRAMGLRNKSGAIRLLAGLQERGHLVRLRNRARAIEMLTHPAIPRAPDGALLFFIPVHAASAN